MTGTRSLVVVLIFTASSRAADWPVFRGSPAMTGTVTAALPDQLAEKWTFKTGDTIEGAPAVVGDTVFVASQDEHLYALELATGKPKWKTKLGPMRASPAVKDGRVYVGDADGMFHAVDAATGKKLWTYETNGEITSGANFHGDLVLIGSHDAVLYGLTIDGKKQWAYEIDGPVNGSPAVADGKVVVAGCDSVLHTVDAATGKRIGTVDLGGQAGATAALVDGRAFVGTMSNQVVGLELAPLKKSWAFEARRRQQPFYSSAAVTDTLVLVGCRDKKLYALNRKTGAEAWAFVTGGQVDASPVVVGGRVYVGSLSRDGEFFVLDAATGRQVQRLQLDGGVSGSAAVAGDVLLVGTENGTLYCLGKK